MREVTYHCFIALDELDFGNKVQQSDPIKSDPAESDLAKAKIKKARQPRI